MTIKQITTNMLRLCSIGLIFFVFPDFVTAQLPGPDSIKIDKETYEVVKSKLDISLEGMSSAIYAGRNYGVDQFGLNPCVAFNHKSGLKLSIFAYGMGKTPGLIAETDFGIGFTQKIGSKFRITPGYSYILNKGDSANLLNNVINIAAELELDFISVGNNAAFSFGKSSAWYDETTLAKYISLFSVEEHTFSLSPSFVMVMGTKESLATFGHGATSYKKSVNKIVGNGNGKGNGKPPAGTTTMSTTTSISKKFMVLSYDFMIPIIYTYKVFSFAVIPHYDIPVNSGAEESTLTGNPFYVTAKITLSLPVSK